MTEEAYAVYAKEGGKAHLAVEGEDYTLCGLSLYNMQKVFFHDEEEDPICQRCKPLEEDEPEETAVFSAVVEEITDELPEEEKAAFGVRI